MRFIYYRLVINCFLSSFILFYSAHSSRPLSFHSLFEFLPLNTLHFLLFSFILQEQSRGKVTTTKAVKVCALCSQWLTHEQTPTQNRRGWERCVSSVVMGDASGGCSSVCIELWRVVLPEGKSSGLYLLAFRFTSSRVSLTRPPQAAFTSSWSYHSEKWKYWEKYWKQRTFPFEALMYDKENSSFCYLEYASHQH